MRDRNVTVTFGAAPAGALPLASAALFILRIARLNGLNRQSDSLGGSAGSSHIADQL